MLTQMFQLKMECSKVATFIFLKIRNCKLGPVRFAETKGDLMVITTLHMLTIYFTAFYVSTLLLCQCSQIMFPDGEKNVNFSAHFQRQSSNTLFRRLTYPS